METVDRREVAKSQLQVLVDRALSDGKLDDSEREDLRKLFRTALLTVSDVRDVFTNYLQDLKKEILADGDVSVADRERCKMVVSELRIPLRLLPPEILDIMLGKKRA